MYFPETAPVFQLSPIHVKAQTSKQSRTLVSSEMLTALDEPSKSSTDRGLKCVSQSASSAGAVTVSSVSEVSAKPDHVVWCAQLSPSFA